MDHLEFEASVSAEIAADVAKARRQEEEIIDTEQDAYARKRWYRNIDELLDDPRRA